MKYSSLRVFLVKGSKHISLPTKEKTTCQQFIGLDSPTEKVNRTGARPFN